MSIRNLVNMVNTTMPYAWDDSLSVYEMLGKLISKINEVVNEVNLKLPDDFEVAFYEKFREYTKDEIVKIVSSGEFETILTSILTGVNEFQDEIIDARQGEVSVGANITEVKSQLTQIAPYNVKKYGAKGNNVDDDSSAIQMAVDAAFGNGGGTVFLPEGKYILHNPIYWRSNVSLIGMGIGKSILKTVEIGDHKFSAIQNIEQPKENPLVNCTFSDFEIDGSGIKSDRYALGAKGLFILHLRNSVFRNLYIHDTVGTGLGCDFLSNSTIDSVIVENCGRLWSSGQIGGAGIGIGTGTWSEGESLVISNCHATNCGNYGIFCENQWLGVMSEFIKIVNCSAIGGKNVGISNKGNNNMIVSNCTISDNISHGFSIEDNSEDCILSGCIITDNGGHGIYTKLRVKKYKIYGCIIARNTGRGIYITNSWADIHGISICENDIYNNLIGISFLGTTGFVLKNTIINNNNIFNNNAIAIEFGTGFDNLTVNNNNVYSNGMDYGDIANGNCAFVFSSDAKFVQIVNNHIFDNQTIQTQRKGILQFVGSTFDNARIEMNDCTGNISNGIELNGTNTNIVRKHNLGDSVITENNGVATIPSGASYITVAHGLSAAPTINQIVVTPSNSLGDATKFWVDTIGVGSFRINVNTDPGVNTATFTWRVIAQ